jgi:hypothetical protein
MTKSRKSTATKGAAAPRKKKKGNDSQNRPAGKGALVALATELLEPHFFHSSEAALERNEPTERIDSEVEELMNLSRELVREYDKRRQDMLDAIESAERLSPVARRVQKLFLIRAVGRFAEIQDAVIGRKQGKTTTNANFGTRSRKRELCLCPKRSLESLANAVGRVVAAQIHGYLKELITSFQTPDRPMDATPLLSAFPSEREYVLVKVAVDIKRILKETKVNHHPSKVEPTLRKLVTQDWRHDRKQQIRGPEEAAWSVARTLLREVIPHFSASESTIRNTIRDRRKRFAGQRQSGRPGC